MNKTAAFIGLVVSLVFGMSGDPQAKYSNGPALASVGCTSSFVGQVFDAGIPRPRGIALVDLDQDGSLDIVVVSHSRLVVSILYGMGNGRFEPPVLIPLEEDITGLNQLHDFAAADLNGDGWIDLVLPSRPGKKTFILVNRGGRVFEPPSIVLSAKGPHDAKVGDFNGDGFPDLAIADRDASTVSVLLNTGGGQFPPRPGFPVGPGPRTLALGDFNEDGQLDIVTANSYSNPGDVTVLLGDGRGEFGSPTSFLTGRDLPRSVRTADFDGDGHLDLVVTHFKQSDGVHQNLVFFRGIGGGQFGPPRAFPTGRLSRGIAVGDFDGDGILDVAVANLRPRRISLLLGSPGPEFTFIPAPSIMAPSPLMDLASGDLNGDGRLDIVASSSNTTNVVVFLNQGVLTDCGLERAVR